MEIMYIGLTKEKRRSQTDFPASGRAKGQESHHPHECEMRLVIVSWDGFGVKKPMVGCKSVDLAEKGC